jgi:hypothetical protein
LPKQVKFVLTDPSSLLVPTKTPAEELSLRTLEDAPLTLERSIFTVPPSSALRTP